MKVKRDPFEEKRFGRDEDRKLKELRRVKQERIEIREAEDEVMIFNQYQSLEVSNA